MFEITPHDLFDFSKFTDMSSVDLMEHKNSINAELMTHGCPHTLEQCKFALSKSVEMAFIMMPEFADNPFFQSMLDRHWREHVKFQHKDEELSH